MSVETGKETDKMAVAQPGYGRPFKRCPICYENSDIIGCDFKPQSNSYCVHFTGKGLHHADIISLCQQSPDGQIMQDFYTPHEAHLIGGWLMRAVLDFMIRDEEMASLFLFNSKTLRLNKVRQEEVKKSE